MFRSLLLLIGLVALWTLSLWFVLPIDLSVLPYRQLILLHVLPPLALGGVGLILRAWRRGRKARALARQQADEEAQQREVMTTARQQREAEWTRLHFGCDCRAAVVTGLGDDASALKSALPETPPADEEGEESDTESDGDAAVVSPVLNAELQEFAGPLRQALESIYQEIPAALALPVYLVPPTHISAIDIIALVRKSIHEIGARLDPPIDVSPDKVQVAFAPSGNDAADSVIELFDRNPDLPGAVLLAFDSPVQRNQVAYTQLATSAQRAAFAADLDERAAWSGAPGRAIVALLLTHPKISAMLATIQGYSQDSDAAINAMTTFWERTAVPNGQLAALARIAPAERETLGRQPVLARIHRSAFGQTELQARTLELNRMCRSLMEKTLLAGGLLPTSRGSDDEAIAPIPETEESKPAALRWLVHNAGTVARCGPRLSALAAAIRDLGFDLHPQDEATNVASVSGDFGLATAWVMLAETVMRSSDTHGAALCADFQQGAGVAMSVVKPAPGL